MESPRVLAADPPEKPPPAARSVGLRPTLGIEIKVTEGGPGECVPRLLLSGACWNRNTLTLRTVDFFLKGI